MLEIEVNNGIASFFRDGELVGQAEAGYWDYLAAGVEQPPCRCGEIECRHGAAHYWGEWPSTAEQMAAAYAAMDRRAAGGGQ